MVTIDEVVESSLVVSLLTCELLSRSITGAVTLLRRSATCAGEEFLTERQIVMTGDAVEIATLIQDHPRRAELICHKPANINATATATTAPAYARRTLAQFSNMSGLYECRVHGIFTETF